jgi:hypothetical protein
MDRNTSMVRFMVDEFSQMLYSTKAEDITLLRKIKELENLDTYSGLIRLYDIRQSYMKMSKRPSKEITRDLLNYINTYDYPSLLKQLRITNEENAA